VTLTVSVALCTYNGARFVERQLRSIFAQDLPPAEVIVSDDGSTDDTIARVRAVFAEHRDSAVALRLIEGDRPLGVTRNFERAVSACTGDLIALSDQDDVWHHDRLSAVVPLFEADPTLLVSHGDARLVDERGEPLGVGLLEALTVGVQEHADIRAGRAFSVYVRRNLATGATMLFRRSLLDVALPFPGEWVHDEWLAIIASASGTITLIDDALIDYRQHGENQIGVKKPTLGYRIRRMLAPRGDRYTALSARAEVLSARLATLVVAPELLQLARDKARFERLRAGYPAARPRRLLPVFREYRAGSYARLSSQGNVDVLRDLLQPR
jgi:glycosyltransferase involved in cell wall biosynthesis